MRIKFNKYEKVAGLFVLAAIVGSVVSTAAIAVKNGWWDSKVSYQIELPSAEGIHSGTVVQIAGLRAGSVTHVELVSSDQVHVRFHVLEKFANKIKTDSQVQIFRPFILGDRVLEVTVGQEGEPLKLGSTLPVQASTDIMDLLSGKKMGSFIGSFEKLTDSLTIVSEAFADPKRIRAMVRTLDSLTELTAGLVKVTNAVNKERRVEHIIQNLANLSQEMNKMLPAFREEVPDLGRQMGQIVKNLNVLTNEFQKLTPAIAAIAPDLPRTSMRAVEALDETVVLLKAMQKSFLLRGNVKEVREEERQPASK